MSNLFCYVRLDILVCVELCVGGGVGHSGGGEEKFVNGGGGGSGGSEDPLRSVVEVEA